MFKVKTCAHCGHEWINGGYCPLCGGPRKEEEDEKETEGNSGFAKCRRKSYSVGKI